MSAYALVIGLLLAGQVGTGGGRYGDEPPPGSTANPFRQGGAAAESPSGNSGTTNDGATRDSATVDGTLPIAESTPPGSRPAAGTTTRSGSTSPYGPLSPIDNGGANGGQLPGSSTLPRSGPNSAVSPPPGANPWATPSSAVTTPATTEVKPSAMMRAMLSAPADSRLTGSGVALAGAVATASSRADQSERVEAYWDLCSSVTDYYLGLREQEKLRRARTQLPRVGPVWEQAQKELAVRVGTSHKAAVAAQYRLASLMGAVGTLPLPADTPHCADYYTHYERIFAGRPNAEAQELATLLPLRYAELRDAAGAVRRAEQWLNSTATRNDTTDGEATVRALELLALRRRAFVQIARDYNRRIARYAELSSPGEVGTMRLLSMLINSTATATATRFVSPAAPPDRQSQIPHSLPKTFDDGRWAPSSESDEVASRDEQVQPASVLLEAGDSPREEKSLLVKPPE